MARPTQSIPRRLKLIVLAGTLAILLGAGVRASPWARERFYSALAPDELALVIHDRPRDPLAFLHYGSALLQMGNVRAAAGAFERAAALDARLVRAHAGAGSAYLRGGQLAKARKSFEEAVRLNPGDSVAQLGLAQAYYRSGSPKRAIPALEAIVKKEPDRAIAWYYLGKMYGDARQSDEAMKALRKAVEINPEEPAFWRDLAQLSRHYSRFDEAEEQLRRSLKLSDKDPLTHYWLGQLLGRKPASSLPEAAHHLREAARLDPQLMEPHFELGRISERQGDLRAAIRHYREAKRIAPNSARPLYHLGSCLVRTGQESEGQRLLKAFESLTQAQHAIEEMENRSRSDPMNPELHLRLARVYRRYENLQGALEQYDIYEQLAPGNALVRRERDECARQLAAETGPRS